MIAQTTCQNCAGAIEFEAERDGESDVCPLCGIQTLLRAHRQKPRPPSAPKNPDQIPWFPFLLVSGVTLAVSTVVYRDEYPGFGALAMGALFTASLIGGLGIYFIPSLLALSRKKKNFAAILALNFFAGWTLVGWVGALVWALMIDEK